MHDVAKENEEFLAHYGKLGMQWGKRTSRGGYVRKGSGTRKTKKTKSEKNAQALAKAQKKLQNEREKTAIKKTKSAIKTEKAARKQVDADAAKAKSKGAVKPGIRQLSDKDLQAKVNRIRLEQDYKKLTKVEKTKAQKVVEKSLDKIGNKAFDTVLKVATKKVLEKAIGKEAADEVSGGKKKKK